jgi:hypothetical protein
MKDEYDFSKAEKGKFYRPGEELKIPVYLDEDVLSYLRGRTGDAELSAVINQILRKEIELLKVLEPHHPS